VKTVVFGLAGGLAESLLVMTTNVLTGGMMRRISDKQAEEWLQHLHSAKKPSKATARDMAERLLADRVKPTITFIESEDGLTGLYVDGRRVYRSYCHSPMQILSLLGYKVDQRFSDDLPETLDA
jgi:hypothetical protein